MNICVVCSGNICRSPFAEGILKRELGSLHKIYSAGTLNIIGSKAYHECIFLARYYKIDLKKHLSQGLASPLLENTDIFLVMTKQHKLELQMQYNIEEKTVKLLGDFLPPGKVFSIGIWGKIQKGDDIPDPMGRSTEDVKPVLDIIELACLAFAKNIQRGEKLHG